MDHRDVQFTQEKTEGDSFFLYGLESDTQKNSYRVDDTDLDEEFDVIRSIN